MIRSHGGRTGEKERERTVKGFRIQLERERKKQDLIMPSKSMSAGAKQPLLD